MASTIIVNGLTNVHKYSGGFIISAAPDFCKILGESIVPFVNIAFSRDLKKGSRTIRTNKVPAALKNSEFNPSYGNELGVEGGVISEVNRGWAKFTNYSFDVWFEGRNVARLTDPMMMNGNNPNTAAPAEMQPNVDIGPGSLLCRIFCWCDAGKKGADFVELMEAPNLPDFTA